MKKAIIVLAIGSFLIIGTLVTNISYTVGIADRINLSNLHIWLLGFILDFVTNPAGLLGVILI